MSLNTQGNLELKVKKSSSLLKLLKAFIIKGKTEAVAACNASKELEIVECIKRAREEWLDANRNFEYADDQQIVDYYTYKIKACEIRYDYLLKKAKEMGIKAKTLEVAGVLQPGNAQSNCY